MPSHFVINPNRVDLAREFKSNPTGPHGIELQRVLDRMHWAPLAGRYAIVVVEPHTRWLLAKMPGVRGERLEYLPQETYHSFEAALWSVFERQWHEITGERLDIT